MVDVVKLRRGDIVRDLFSRKRYRVICAVGCYVYLVHSRLRRYRPDKAFLLNAHWLEAVK